MLLAVSTSASTAIARKPYAASHILRAHVTRDQRDEARCNARGRVMEAMRGL
jgi:hypothetical protein